MDKYVGVRFVRPDGAEFVVDGADWLLTGANGVEAPDYQVYSSDNAVGDGSTITGRRVAARAPEFFASVIDSANNAVLRSAAMTFFRPKMDYKIFFTYLGVTRWISGELTAFKAPAAPIYEPQTFAAYFLCAGSYWQSVSDFGQDIAAVQPCWGFPYMDHPAYGVRVAAADFAQEVVFDYDGDAPAYFKATVTCDGPVTNPQITIGDSYVRVLIQLQPGDLLSIDPQAARVLLNGENILVRVDRTSNFTGMQMLVGENRMSFGADVGENDMHVVIYYNKQYLGV